MAAVGVVLAIFFAIYLINRVLDTTMRPLHRLTEHVRSIDIRAGATTHFPRAAALGVGIGLLLIVLGAAVASVELAVIGIVAMVLLGGNLWAGGDLDDTVWQMLRNTFYGVVLVGLNRDEARRASGAPSPSAVFAGPARQLDAPARLEQPGSAPAGARKVQLGVRVASRTPAGRAGVPVTAVTPGSAGERAGLRVADLITTLAGTPTPDAAALQAAAAAASAGPVPITFSRGGVPYTATVSNESANLRKSAVAEHELTLPGATATNQATVHTPAPSRAADVTVRTDPSATAAG